MKDVYLCIRNDNNKYCNDMKDKIREILVKHSDNKNANDNIEAELLGLFSVSKFDMEKFKEYVNTYDKRKNGLDNDETIVKDMLYGIGLCLDKEEYCFNEGYKNFKAFLKELLW